MPLHLNKAHQASPGAPMPSANPLRPCPQMPSLKNPWPRICAATLFISALVACSGKDASSQANAGKPASEPTVGVVVLTTESQTLSTELAGRTSAFQSADIRPQINGIIQKRHFTEGALVKAGTVV